MSKNNNLSLEEQFSKILSDSINESIINELSKSYSKTNRLLKISKLIININKDKK